MAVPVTDHSALVHVKSPKLALRQFNFMLKQELGPGHFEGLIP